MRAVAVLVSAVLSARLTLNAADTKCINTGGTCMDNADRTCPGGPGNVKKGLCNGGADRKCCMPSAPAEVRAPPPAPSGGSGGCGAYSSAAKQSIEGNNNVVYQVYKIDPAHWSGSQSDLNVDPTTKDNTMEVSTACAFDKMHNAAKADGITLRINSGFRTLARQQYFYDCYITKKCNGGNLAAKPGTSNHGVGRALDLDGMCSKQTSTRSPGDCSAAYAWMRKNANTYGFVRTVNKETWHWEYRPGQSAPGYQ